MRRVRLELIVAAAALSLAACADTDRPQEYQIDQDIYATHGAGAPTSTNPGAPGFETWRRTDRDTYGRSSGH